MPALTAERLKQDRARYVIERDRLLGVGLAPDHLVVTHWQQRIDTVDRLLADPHSGGGG